MGLPVYRDDMRAMTYRSYGGPEVLELAEVPKPSPAEGQLLVRVVRSSVNPVDWKRATGALRVIMPACFPLVPGYDLAGEVVELGAGVADFAIGDRVHARIGEHAGGASADLALIGVDVAAKMPEGMDFDVAAGLPLAGMTALQGLRDQAKIPLENAKERVLVVGASGGVGHLAVQIARAMGTTVVGVCSTRNVALVRELGAHEVIDYTQPDPYRGQAPFDVVLDCVAGDSSPFLPLLGPGGRYASCLPGAAVFARSMLNPLTDKKVRPVLLKSRAVDLQWLDELYARRALRVIIDSHFALEDLKKAWERSMTGRTVGKIVIDVGAGGFPSGDS